MKRIKKAAAFILILSTMFSNIAFADENINLKLEYDGKIHTYNDRPIHLVINGEELTDLTMPPIILNDFTLVPLRAVFERLGAVVDWKPETKEIYVGIHDDLVLLQVDNKYANVNGNIIEMAVEPKIINDNTMIPLRFVSESLGFQVDWEDEESRTAFVTDIAYLVSQNGVDPVMPQQTPEPIVNPVSTPTPLSTATPIQDISTIQTPAQSKDISTEVIKEENKPLTKINKIVFPSEATAVQFKIEAASAISKIDKIILPDNRIAVDIYNAEMTVNAAGFPQLNSAIIESVRVGQFQNDPVKIARVVFDIKTAVSFSVSLDADRKVITVSFGETVKNKVTNIDFKSDGTADYLSIDFEKTPTINSFVLTDPERIVVDLPFATLQKPSEGTVAGVFAKVLRASQFSESTARIVIELGAKAKFNVTTEGNRVILKLVEPTYKNITYDFPNRTFKITKNPAFKIDVNTMVHTDSYNALMYKITLAGDYSSMLGHGEYIINNEQFYSVNIQNNSAGQTELIVNEKNVFAYNVSEDEQFVYIKAVSPKEKYSKIVVLDPGHGGGDNGAAGNGLIEKELTFDIANRVYSLIEKENKIKVYATRRTDVKIDLSERPQFGNAVGDMFVSIHINSHKTNFQANGLETYYFPHENDSQLGFTSLQLATMMQSRLISTLGANDRKVKTEEYVVIKYSTIPSILIELGFISNVEDADKLRDENYRQKIAEGIYAGILDAFEKYTPKR